MRPVTDRGSDMGLLNDNPNRQGFVALPQPSVYNPSGLYPLVYRTGNAQFNFEPRPEPFPRGASGRNFPLQIGSVYQPMENFPVDDRSSQINLGYPIPPTSNFGGIDRALRVYDLAEQTVSPYQIFAFSPR